MIMYSIWHWPSGMQGVCLEFGVGISNNALPKDIKDGFILVSDIKHA